MTNLIINNRNFYNASHSGFLVLTIGIVLMLTSAVYPQNENGNPTKESPSGLNQWLGKYEFNSTSLFPNRRRRSSSGTMPEHIYTLKLSKASNTDSVKCNFLAEGVQLYDEFVCNAKAVGNNLQIYFVKDLTEKEDEFIPYKKGDLMFTLQPSTKFKDKFLYVGSVYDIFVYQAKKKRKYFSRK